MITLAHVGLGFAVKAAKMKHINAGSEELYRGFSKMVPWIVLPDGIRNFIGARQAGHHEVSINGGVSWMEYPVAGVLKNMTKEDAKELLELCFLFYNDNMKPLGLNNLIELYKKWEATAATDDSQQEAE